MDVLGNVDEVVALLQLKIKIGILFDVADGYCVCSTFVDGSFLRLAMQVDSPHR